MPHMQQKLSIPLSEVAQHIPPAIRAIPIRCSNPSGYPWSSHAKAHLVRIGTCDPRIIVNLLERRSRATH